MTAQQFTGYLIDNHSVGVVAGTAFGDRGEGHVRFTYDVPDDGLGRIRDVVERI
jgi:aspartate/methionine/tyrosine aminotransferase